VARAWGAEALGAASGRQAVTLLLYAIATMDAAAPLPSLADQSPTWASASRGARGWKLNQLADPLGGDVWPRISRRVDSRHPTMGRLWQECANRGHSETVQRSDRIGQRPGFLGRRQPVECRIDVAKKAHFSAFFSIYFVGSGASFTVSQFLSARLMFSLSFLRHSFVQYFV
jgi:hypothetical protein